MAGVTIEQGMPGLAGRRECNMKIMKMLSILAGVAVWGSAGAIEWATNRSSSIPLNLDSIWCSTTACNKTATGTGLTGSVIKLTAYSTQIISATNSGNASPDDSGTWVKAQIDMYSDGVGITNVRQTFSSSAGVASEGTGSPQHAIDNRGVNDILVIDFNPRNTVGQDYWDVSSFYLGWTCQMLNNATATVNSNSGICPTSTPNQVGKAVNADAWLGGTSEITNFLNMSFSGGVPTIGGQTFTSLALNPDGTIGVGARNNSGATDLAKGRYLIIAPSLAGHTDAFKVKSISASMTTPPPPPNGHQVPVPGSVPLVGLALLALAWVSRSRRLRAIPIRIRR
jgi:hypothetical protein